VGSFRQLSFLGRIFVRPVLDIVSIFGDESNCLEKARLMEQNPVL
jgi:hypothetical protein